jgi:hypothetical protein
MKTRDILLRDSGGRVWLQTSVDGNVRSSYVGALPDAELERYALERGMQVVDVLAGRAGRCAKRALTAQRGGV